MADKKIRHPQTLEERVVPEGAVRFFTNQGYVVLDSAGRVNTRATSAAATSKEQ